jgi:hypothetical protein
VCSQADVPPYDIPEPQPPRVYRLAGDAPEEPRGSVALAVLGTLITEEESRPRYYGRWHAGYLFALREARDAVAAVESAS